MAVKTDFFKTREDGVDLYCTYSDKSMKIRKIGTDDMYDEAVDVENAGFEYDETEIESEEFTDAEFRKMFEEVIR